MCRSVREGDSGFQAHSLEAFAKYQHDNAWIWEHQALSRARFVAGSPEVGRKFENNVLTGILVP